MENAVKRVREVPEASYGLEEEHLRRTIQALDGLLNGQGNNHFSVTLDPDSTSTTIIALNATFQTVVQLSPMSAEAAAAFALGNIYALAKSKEIVIRHPSGPDSDRTFGVLING